MNGRFISVMFSLCFQLSLIRSQGLPERQAALEEKKVTITDIQASITKEKERQAKLQKELEKIRTLQPKV